MTALPIAALFYRPRPPQALGPSASALDQARQRQFAGTGSKLGDILAGIDQLTRPTEALPSTQTTPANVLFAPQNVSAPSSGAPTPPTLPPLLQALNGARSSAAPSTTGAGTSSTPQTIGSFLTSPLGSKLVSSGAGALGHYLSGTGGTGALASLAHGAGSFLTDLFGGGAPALGATAADVLSGPAIASGVVPIDTALTGMSTVPSIGGAASGAGAAGGAGSAGGAAGAGATSALGAVGGALAGAGLVYGLGNLFMGLDPAPQMTSQQIAATLPKRTLASYAAQIGANPLNPASVPGWLP